MESLYDKKPFVDRYDFPNGHIQLWELDHQEGSAPKSWCLQIVVLEKTSESPLDSKEIESVNLKGNQHWILIWRTDAEVEAPAFWSSDETHWKSPWCYERLKAEREDSIREWDGWMASNTMDMNLGKLWEMVRDREAWHVDAMGSQRVRHDWVTKQQNRYFQWSCLDVRVGLWRKLSAKKLMLLNCGVGEDSWESLGLQGDPTSPSWRR